MGADQPVARRELSDSDLLGLLQQAANEIGARAWIVGGYVRDKLLGLPHPNPDVVVEEGKGHELAARFAALAKAPPPVVFERFGTAQVTVPGHIVEFVSARAESYPHDSRKPLVRPATLSEDLERRDFTINTLLMSFDGHVEDRLGVGVHDLEDKILRTPAPPEQTFNDDPLRMLRAIRFAAELGFEPAPEIPPAMRAVSGRLVQPVISVERIAEELRKMLVSPRPARALTLMDEGGLLQVVLPELAACKGVEQGGYHTHDVFGHTLLVVQGVPADIVTRLAALFHDVGKPLTATADGAFTGHEEVGAKMAAEALGRLRFPLREAEVVARLVQMHLRPVYYKSEWSDGAVRRLARDAGPHLERLMALARADLKASAYPDQAKLDELEGRLRQVLEERPTRLESPVDGEDIMRVRGIAAGRDVGRIKARLTELVLEGEIPADREAVLAYLAAHPEL